MCGINGFNFIDESIAKAMNDSIIHRGPDNQSVWSNNFITFGHVRLSIIDVSASGNQPLHYHHNGNNYSIVFNGEIYNYIELRNELKLNEYNFSSNSDTEVVLAAYDFWGETCVHKFNGMWSFCIFDEKKNILFCSRDRLGVKPFCYYYQNNKFIFSSELKAILEHKVLNIKSYKNINIDAVDLYFSSGMIPAPYTIYTDVWKLESGHNLIFDINTSKLRKYKYLNIHKQEISNNKSALLDEMDYLFTDSIKLRMRSDVPVGSFLSGGIDSTSIVYGILNNQKENEFHTFSVGFEGKFDETPFIKMSYKPLSNLNHHHEYYDKVNWQNDKDTYAFVFDEPFGDYSGFPTLHVSKMARKHTTVVQSGDGGDEIFGGYPIYGRALIIERLNGIPLFLREALLVVLKKNNSPSFRFAKEAIKLSILDKQNFWANYLAEERIYSETYRNWAIEKLTECVELSNGSLAEALRIYDLLYDTLSDRFLTKVDKASMFNSIEVRSPFLDYRFIEFSQKIPEKYKFNIGETKILLKDYITQNIPNLPKEIIHRKKQGFTPPIKNWLAEDFDTSNMKQLLSTIETISPRIYQFYSILLSSNELDTYMLEFLVRLRIFNDWYAKWIKN
jgi:asparagine synthase (glutamine-hydrolysing)